MGLRKKEINDYKVYVLWVVVFFCLHKTHRKQPERVMMFITKKIPLVHTAK